MSQTTQEALSVLALDIGTVFTRALLFEVVEETYHFIASGVTSSTLNEPVNDATIGVLEAIRQLQALTGRILLDEKNMPIVPSQAGGEGIDRLFMTYSIGKQLRIATFGLMGDVSLQSCNKLAATIPGNIVESISLNDPRTIQDQIDDTLVSRPELILFAGGTDRGASRSVKKMAYLIASVLQLIPKEQRAPVVYSGNQLLVKPVKEILDPFTQFNSTVNIRPEMDNEELEQAAEDLAQVVTAVHSNEINTLRRLTPMCNDTPCPSATAIGRITRFLSKVGDPEKGVLSIDLGASATITASAVAGKMDLNVFPVGSAQGFEKFLTATSMSEISQWFPAGTLLEEASDQLWQKTLFPASIPMTHEALTVDQAAYRQLLRYIMNELSARGVLAQNGYETILCSGSALTQAGNPAQLLMLLLDGIQPKGISTFILDSHAILSTLGAIARTLPLLPVQVLESTAFANLATVISTTSALRPGNLALRARLQYTNGKSQEVKVKQGTLAVLPLRTGESAMLELELNPTVQVETGELADTHFKVNGGLCGLIIDARGRPLTLPTNIARREELLQRWNSMLNIK